MAFLILLFFISLSHLLNDHTTIQYLVILPYDFRQQGCVHPPLCNCSTRTTNRLPTDPQRQRLETGQRTTSGNKKATN